VGPYSIYGVTWGSPRCLGPLWDLWGEVGPYGICEVTWGSSGCLGPLWHLWGDVGQSRTPGSPTVSME